MNCRPHLPQLRSVFMILQWRLGKNSIHGKVRGKSHRWPKRTRTPVSHLLKNIWIRIQEFWAKMLEFLEGVPCYIWRKPTQHFMKRTSYQHGGGSVVVWGCCAASGPGWLAIIDGIMNSVGGNALQVTRVT